MVSGFTSGSFWHMIHASPPNRSAQEPTMNTYILRLPGNHTHAIAVDAESFAEAKRITNQPNATGNAVFPHVAKMLLERGIALRFEPKASEHE